MHETSTLHIVWVCWPPCTMYMAFDIPGERRGGDLRLASSLKKVKKVQMHWGLNGNLEPQWMEYGIKIVAVDFNWLAGTLPSLLPSFSTATTLSSFLSRILKILHFGSSTGALKVSDVRCEAWGYMVITCELKRDRVKVNFLGKRHRTLGNHDFCISFKKGIFGRLIWLFVDECDGNLRYVIRKSYIYDII